MRYEINVIEQSEFEHLIQLVETSMQSRRSDVGFNPIKVRLVTSDLREFEPGISDAKIRANKSVGMAYPYRGDIWIKEGRDWWDTRITAIHELSHLATPEQAHGPKWRQVFGVTLVLMLREWNRPESDIAVELYSYVMSYRKHRSWTPNGDYNPPANHHAQVMAERDKLLRQANKVKA